VEDFKSQASFAKTVIEEIDCSGFQGQDIPGPWSLRAPQWTSDDCCKWCRSVKECKSWVWHKKMCYLKEIKAAPVKLEGTISGYSKS